MPGLAEFKYRAFISYSHADTAFAKWLHRGLESFRIDKDLVARVTARGTIPQALRPIFRDRDEFTAGHALAEQTLAALNASHALIVVCSPASAKSRYVNEEIRLFKSRHPERPVIPLIVGGKPDDPEFECFPPAMKFRVDAKGRVTKKKVELLAADAREEGDGKNLALAKVVAGLLGVSSDEIFRRAERERRAAARRTRLVQAAFGLLGFAVLAGTVGWMNQDYLRERWRWYTVLRPYMMTEFRSHVLSPEAERALKAKDSFRECAKDCPAMVVVPAGKFMMGAAIGEKGWDVSDAPKHEVTIGKPLAVSKLEVTFDDWDVCVAYSGCDAQTDDSGFGRGRRPVINVSWDDAKRYVAWLSRMTGKTYRLLSEAEWEYAARAGTTTAYPWGDEVGNGNANCNGCKRQEWSQPDPLEQPLPVGSFAANPFGLYDMNGNACEWVEDCAHETYDGAPNNGSVWTADGDCKSHVLRGGSWSMIPDDIRSTFRIWYATDFRAYSPGFRVARTLDQ